MLANGSPISQRPARWPHSEKGRPFSRRAGLLVPPKTYFTGTPHVAGGGRFTINFVPYGGDVARLGGAKDVRLVHGFRRALLLHGVDLPGLGGMTAAAHTEADVERTTAAVAGSVGLLRAEGLA